MGCPEFCHPAIWGNISVYLWGLLLTEFPMGWGWGGECRVSSALQRSMGGRLPPPAAPTPWGPGQMFFYIINSGRSHEEGGTIITPILQMKKLRQRTAR